jgi:ABC-type polysaccharide/polyol phosphate export permease
MSQGEGEEHLVPLWGKRSLPRLPFIVMADLFRSRHLLKLLVKRDLNARYRRAYLGYAWAVLEPLLLAIVYTFIFTILVGSSDPLYPVKIVIGVIGWSMFARSLTTSTKSLSSSINLFQFARVPKTVFATSGTLTNVVLALISLSSLIPFYFISDLPITANLLLVPIWLLVLSFTGWGIGLLLAPIACKVPDVLNLINFLVRAGFFLSPVMWTYDMFNSRFGEGWHAVVAHLNPTVIPITGMRMLCSVSHL